MEKKEKGLAQKEKIKNYYIKRTIEKSIKEKQNEIIRKNYAEVKINQAKQDCAIRHTIEAINCGDKSRLAYHNCYSRWHGFKATYEEFKTTIEIKFRDGMSWDNYPQWEIDHIIPLVKNGEHCVNNLQPLWKTENRTKGAKI